MTLPRQERPTDRQLVVLRCIHAAIRDTGFPPTLRELGVMIGANSTNGPRDHLVALERKGFLEISATKSRGIRLTDRGRRLCGERRGPPPIVLKPKPAPELAIWARACKELRKAYGDTFTRLPWLDALLNRWEARGEATP
jgi:SOS-response transcriptional repressor LexA